VIRKGKMEERRLYKRYNLIVSVKYTDRMKNTEGKAKTKNISSGGICISSHSNLTVDYFVNLEFSLPGKTIRALGKVLWSEQILPHL
jgi:c-di-GMP-binding flagellar brake protein YcgR